MSVKASSVDDIQDAIEGDAEVQDERPSTGDGQTQRSASMQAVAKGETPRGEMNNTETRFSRLLDACEDVEWWAYERLRVRYGDKGWHAPDFLVLLSNGHLMVAEVKAHMTDAGRTRFKAGARAMPIMRWVMYVQKGKRQPWGCKYDTKSKDGAPIL